MRDKGDRVYGAAEDHSQEIDDVTQQWDSADQPIPIRSYRLPFLAREGGPNT